MVSVRDAIQAGDLGTFADALAPDVVWIGLWPGELCRNREDVVEMLKHMQERNLPLQFGVIADKGDVLVVDPGFDGRHHVLSLSDEQVSEVRVYPDRQSALAAVENRPW
jgi:hypothetical protein